MSVLKIAHNYGFFSCSSVRLHCIIEYFNNIKTLPDDVDCSAVFEWYKLNTKRDITFEYFNHYSEYDDIVYTKQIDYIENYQYADYSKLEYEDIQPFINKYFSPSVEVEDIIIKIEKKYKIDYNNICVLFYRGNDKNTETKICGYDEYITIAKDILKKNPDIIFLIQSDETEFIKEMTQLFPNSFYFKEEIRHIPKQNSTVDKTNRQNIDVFSKNYLGITIIMSKCKYIVCGTGNCSIWIMLYRGNNKNVYQNVNDKWIYNIEQ